MKRPYIIYYMETHELRPSPILFYDNETQINYMDEQKSIKALGYGPETSQLTENIENSDPDESFLGPDTTCKTATIENMDQDEYLVGPETTKQTFTIENDDKDEMYMGPETTRITRSIENSDSDEIIIM